MQIKNDRQRSWKFIIRNEPHMSSLKKTKIIFVNFKKRSYIKTRKQSIWKKKIIKSHVYCNRCSHENLHVLYNVHICIVNLKNHICFLKVKDILVHCILYIQFVFEVADHRKKSWIQECSFERKKLTTLVSIQLQTIMCSNVKTNLSCIYM